MPKRAVVLIEDDPREAVVARTALLLHAPGAAVIEKRSVRSALGAMRHADIAILGRRAARAPLPSLPLPAVAIVPGLTAAQKKRAAAAGIAAYERPRRWKAYCALIRRLLGKRPSIRTGSAPRRARTS